MAMFGGGGGGNFDPGNWIDHNIYNVVMNGDGGGSHRHFRHNHNHNNDNNNDDKFKVLKYLFAGGTIFWFVIAIGVLANTSDDSYIIRDIFIFLPFIWMLVFGIIIAIKVIFTTIPDVDSEENQEDEAIDEDEDETIDKDNEE